ncbi:acid phosphatase type 7-like [Mytilus galloprovincialis]|uniref:acid phosphatase type 7-like n=1 Tax=Mytilus galloprovincialis TaxID=29158 RepID=UPI003F7C1A43
MEICIWIGIFLFYIPNFSSSLTHYQIQETKVPCHPCHVHLSYGDSPSDITVMWATDQNCNSTLSYGTDPWNYHNTIDADMTHFDHPTSNGLTCIYRVPLKNLQPNTTYFYRPTSGGISSGPHFFKTPEQATNITPEFLICGNHGGDEEDSIPYIDTEVLSGQYDAVLHVGNFAPDQKNKTDENTTICYPRSGDFYMSMMSNMAARIPHMATPGNHVTGDLFSQYRHWFSMPGTSWPIPLDRMWYSFDIGPVHFISYSTEVYFLDNELYIQAQNNWLIQDLTSINLNRTAHPWIVAFGHRPMYCSSGDDCATSDSKVRKGLENIFFTYGVDVIIQGHGHSYERLFPLYQGQVLSNDYNNPKGPVQLITGTSNDQVNVKSETTQSWSALRIGGEGLNSFSRMKVYNTTHLMWEQISPKDKKVLDSIWIIQERHGPFIAPKPKEPISKPKVNIEGDTPVSNKDESEKIPSKATDTASATGNENTSGKPSSSVVEFFDQTSNKVLVGVGVGIISLALIISVVVLIKKKQRIRSYRRWDATVDYGRKFYSAYSQVGKDEKDGSDFEVDSTEGNPSSKLLADK